MKIRFKWVLEPDNQYKKDAYYAQRQEQWSSDVPRKRFSTGFEIVHRYGIGDAYGYKRRDEVDRVEIDIERPKLVGADIVCKQRRDEKGNAPQKKV